ncbi:MAG TPA: hypothetical protein PLP27_10985 [Crocinitomicaceae bacterium]|nr:hypothetical protein [Crocinitomicaceae bacterium]
MARTIREIYDEMISEKETMTELSALQPNISSYQTLMNDLTTQSKVAVWRLIFFVVAFSIWTVEKLFDEHVTSVEKRIAELVPGTLFWYQSIALKFQIGHVLEWNAQKLVYEYAIADEDAQIVKLCAVSEAGGYLAMKLAKLDGDGNPEKLDAGELLAFKTDYMERMKYAGVFVNYISVDPDKLRLKLKVFYNPSVLAADGSLLSDNTKFPVNDTVNDYLKLMPFNGIFNVTDLIDRLQKVNGVINPLFISASAQFGGYPFAPVADYYQPNAGYMVMDTVVPLDVEYVLL